MRRKWLAGLLACTMVLQNMAPVGFAAEVENAAVTVEGDGTAEDLILPEDEAAAEAALDAAEAPADDEETISETASVPAQYTEDEADVAAEEATGDADLIIDEDLIEDDSPDQDGAEDVAASEENGQASDAAEEPAVSEAEEPENAEDGGSEAAEAETAVPEETEVAEAAQTEASEAEEALIEEEASTEGGLTLLAEGEEISIDLTIQAVVPSVSMGDPDDLFAAYANSILGITVPGSGKGKLKTPRRGYQLNESESRAVALLRDFVADVAAGNRTETRTSLTSEELGLGEYTWTTEELGVTSVLNEAGTGFTEEAENAIQGKFNELLSWGKVIDVLCAEYPYEMYWLDIERGCSPQATRLGISGSEEGGNAVTLLSENIWDLEFYVSSDYALENSQNDAGFSTRFDTTKVEMVQSAAENAGSIVAEYAAYDDDAKLRAYADRICSLTDYNYTAANAGNSMDYGNPWQLIHVFDGDPETMVVCEGYAKAFKYLCDLTSFSSNQVNAILATGYSIDPREQYGPHMWNIVTLEDGYNYLMDVTNMDQPSRIDDSLCLAEALEGSVEEGYAYQFGSEKLRYKYDSETLSMYDADDLKMKVEGETETEEWNDIWFPLSETVVLLPNWSRGFSGEFGGMHYSSDNPGGERVTFPVTGIDIEDDTVLELKVDTEKNPYWYEILGLRQGTSKVTIHYRDYDGIEKSYESTFIVAAESYSVRINSDTGNRVLPNGTLQLSAIAEHEISVQNGEGNYFTEQGSTDDLVYTWEITESNPENALQISSSEGSTITVTAGEDIGQAKLNVHVQIQDPDTGELTEVASDQYDVYVVDTYCRITEPTSIAQIQIGEFAIVKPVCVQYTTGEEEPEELDPDELEYSWDYDTGIFRVEETEVPDYDGPAYRITRIGMDGAPLTLTVHRNTNGGSEFLDQCSYNLNSVEYNMDFIFEDEFDNRLFEREELIYRIDTRNLDVLKSYELVPALFGDWVSEDVEDAIAAGRVPPFSVHIDQENHIAEIGIEGSKIAQLQAANESDRENYYLAVYAFTYVPGETDQDDPVKVRLQLINESFEFYKDTIERHYPLDDYDTVMPDWGKDFSTTINGEIRDAEHKDGERILLRVTNLALEQDDENPVLRVSQNEDGWHVDATGTEGEAAILITSVPMNDEGEILEELTETRRFVVSVIGNRYETRIDTQTGDDRMLTGSQLILNAQVTHWAYDPEEKTEYIVEGEEFIYEWMIPEEHESVMGFAEDPGPGSASVTVTGLESGEALVCLKVYAPAEEDQEPRLIGEESIELSVMNEYTELQPHLLNEGEPIKIGETIEVEPKLFHCYLDANGQPVYEQLTNVQYRWAGNFEAALVRDSDGNVMSYNDEEEYTFTEAGSGANARFLITRIADYEFELQLYAEVWNVEEGEGRWKPAAEENYWIDSWDYDRGFWFEDLNDDWRTRLYEGGETTFRVNTEGLDDAGLDYRIEWSIGKDWAYDEDEDYDYIEAFDEIPYSLSDDRKAITFVWDALMEYPEVKEWLETMDEAGDQHSLLVVARAVLDVPMGDGEDPLEIELANTETRVCPWDIEVERWFQYGDEEVMLPYWDWDINDEFDARIWNSEYPNGGDIRLQVTDVMVENEDSENPAIELEVYRDEENDCFNGANMHATENLGDAEITIYFIDYDGTEQTHTFTVHVAGDRYNTRLDTETNSDMLVTGAVRKLIAKIEHEAFDPENGHHPVSVDQVIYEWELLQDEGDPVLELVTDGSTGDPDDPPFICYVRALREGDAAVRVTMYETDGEEERHEVGWEERELHVTNYYSEIYPGWLNSAMEVGSAQGITPHLYFYYGEDSEESSGEFQTVRYRWSFNPDDVIIRDRAGNILRFDEDGEFIYTDGCIATTESPASFTITRLARNDFRIWLDAELPDTENNWEFYSNREYYFDWKDYDIHFEEQNYGDHAVVFPDGQTEFVLNTDGLEGLDEQNVDYEIIWQAGHRNDEDELEPVDDNFYSVDSSNGWPRITINGEAMSQIPEIERQGGVEINAILKITVSGPDSEELVLEMAQAGTWVELRQTEAEYDWPFDDPMILLPEEDRWIYRNFRCRVRNSEHPDWAEDWAVVTNVTVEQDEENPALELHVNRDEEGAFTGANLRATYAGGEAEVTVYYLDPFLPEEEQAKECTFTVYVQSDRYNVWMNSSTGTNHMLPGSSLWLKADVDHDHFDPLTGQQQVSTDNIYFKWEIPEEFKDRLQIVEYETEDGGHRDEWALIEAIPGDWDDNRAGIRVCAWEPDEDGENSVQVGEDYWDIWINDYYTQIVLIEPEDGINGDLWIGQSVTVVPELRAYGDEYASEDADYSVLSEVRWRWEYDENQVEMRDAEGNLLTWTGNDEDGWEYQYTDACEGENLTFTLTRKTCYDTDVKLIAEVKDENGEWRDETEENWHLNHRPYDVWFEGLNHGWDHTVVFDNGTVSFVVNTEQLDGVMREVDGETGNDGSGSGNRENAGDGTPEWEIPPVDYTILWEFASGRDANGDPHEFETDVEFFTLSEDKHRITLDGAAMARIQKIAEREELMVCARIILNDADGNPIGVAEGDPWEIACTQNAWVELWEAREPEYEYPYDENIWVLPNWDKWIEAGFTSREFTSEYPDGHDVWTPIEEVTIESRNEDPAAISVTLEQKWEDDGSILGWNLHATETMGEAAVTIRYRDPFAEDPSDEAALKEYTFTVHVGGDVWNAWIDVEENSWAMKPGDSKQLVAHIDHQIWTEEYQGPVSTEKVEFEWKIPEEFQQLFTLTPDPEYPDDASIRMLVASEEQEGGGRIEVRMYEWHDKYDEETGEPTGEKVRDEVGSAEVWMNVQNEFTEILPGRLTYERAVPGVLQFLSPTTTIHTTQRDGTPISYEADPVRYRWEIQDPDRVIVRDANGENVGQYDEETGDYIWTDASYDNGTEFTIIRTNTDDTRLTLIAESHLPGEDWKEICRRDYWLNGVDYDVHFADPESGDYRDYGIVSDKAEISFLLSGDGLREITESGGDFDVTWLVGRGWNAEDMFVEIPADEADPYWTAAEDEETGLPVITFHGEKMAQIPDIADYENVQLCAKITVPVEDERYEVARCDAHVDLFYEEQNENFPLEDYMEVLAGNWSVDIDCVIDAWIRDMESPDGRDEQWPILSVAISDPENPAADLKDLALALTERKENDVPSWHLEAKDQEGTVKVTVTYKTAEDPEATETRECIIKVCADVYNLWIDTEDGSNMLHPGEEIILEAFLTHDAYDIEMHQMTHDTSTEDATFEWSIIYGEDRIAEITYPEGDSAHRQAIVRAAQEGRPVLEVVAYVPGNRADGDGRKEVGRAQYDLSIWNTYAELLPIRVSDQLGMGGAELAITPQFMEHELAEDGGDIETEIEQVRYYWQYDENALEIRDAEGKLLPCIDEEDEWENLETLITQASYGKGRTFNVSRKLPYSTEITLVSQRYNEDDDQWYDDWHRRYWLDDVWYDIWYKDLAEEDDFLIPAEKTSILELDTSNLDADMDEGDYKLEWLFGQVDPNTDELVFFDEAELEDGAITVADDGKSVTFDPEKLAAVKSALDPEGTVEDSGHLLIVTRAYVEIEKAEGEEPEHFIIAAWGTPAVLMADYSAVDAALAEVADLTEEADGDLHNIYTDETVAALEDAIDAVERTKDITQQAEVDAMAQAIEESIAALELKPADYTALDAALAAVSEDLSIYTEETVAALTAAKEAAQSVDRDLDITQQAQVDALTDALEQATTNLVEKPADYTAVDTALAKVPAEEALKNYTDETVAALEEAIAAVDRTKTITQQADVDAMAQAIEDALEALTEKPADYSAVDAALAKVPTEEALKDYTDETAQALKDAIVAVDRTKTITHQAEVDAMAQAIENALDALTPRPEADYSEVDAAIANVPTDLSGYTDATSKAVTDAVNAVKRGLTDNHQSEVDAMAAAINAAVAGLVGDLTKADISTLSDVVYSGKAFTPVPTVKLNGKTLTLGTNFTVSYSNNVNVGTATVTLTGKGSNTGTVSRTFKITPKKITPAVTLSPTVYTYDGKEKKPAVTVKDGATVIPATSYTVTWPAGRKNAGTYNVTVTLKGNYSGSHTVPFTINKAAQTLTAKAAAASIVVGKTTTISVAGTKESPKLTYTSANTAVATVSAAGVVTAKKAGTVNITVTAAATTNYTAKSAVVTVKVTAPPAPAKLTLIAAYNGAHGVGVKWIKLAGATEYTIWQKYNGVWRSIKTIKPNDSSLKVEGNTLMYTDQTVKTGYGKGYIYSVSAKIGSTYVDYDKAGVAIYRLNPPTITKVTNSAAGTATVTWKSVFGKTETNGAYDLQYATEADAKAGKWTNAMKLPGFGHNVTSANVTGLKKGTKYIFRIRCSKTNKDRGTFYSEYSPWMSVQIKK